MLNLNVLWTEERIECFTAYEYTHFILCRKSRRVGNKNIDLNIKTKKSEMKYIFPSQKAQFAHTKLKQRCWFWINSENEKIEYFIRATLFQAKRSGSSKQIKVEYLMKNTLFRLKRLGLSEQTRNEDVLDKKPENEIFKYESRFSEWKGSVYQSKWEI